MSYCKKELAIKNQLSSSKFLVEEGLMELLRHLEDRTGEGTTTVRRWTTVQNSMGTLATQTLASTTIFWEEEGLCQV